MNSEYSDQTIRKILRTKKRFEKKLKVKIEVNGNNISLEGDGADTYVAENVFKAIDKNFPINTALLLIDEEYITEDIHIKDITKKKNLEQIRARIIGTKGKTLQTLSQLSECNIVLHENTVSIIGHTEKIKEAVQAVENLIRGSKQSNVYKFLERQKAKEMPADLGLRKQKTKQ